MFIYWLYFFAFKAIIYLSFPSRFSIFTSLYLVFQSLNQCLCIIRLCLYFFFRFQFLFLISNNSLFSLTTKVFEFILRDFSILCLLLFLLLLLAKFVTSDKPTACCTLKAPRWRPGRVLTYRGFGLPHQMIRALSRFDDPGLFNFISITIILGTSNHGPFNHLSFFILLRTPRPFTYNLIIEGWFCIVDWRSKIRIYFL